MIMGDRAKALLATALEIDAAAVPSDASIASLEAWDSLAHLRLVQALEKELGHELPAEHIFAIATLADVAAVLEGRPIG
jgi:acyl carrier protein